jgi:hypothetical protein
MMKIHVVHCELWNSTNRTNRTGADTVKIRLRMDVVGTTEVGLLSNYSYGDEGNRTPDLLNAIQALSHLSYTPVISYNIYIFDKKSTIVQVQSPTAPMDNLDRFHYISHT